MEVGIAEEARRRRGDPGSLPTTSWNGARSPEELETLLEDTLLIRDMAALAGLFEDGALLAIGDRAAGRGTEEIALQALAMWGDERSYVADPRHIMQARDVALVLSEHGVNVAQRGRDGTWRFAIVHLFLDDDAGTT